jgi:hypothetical protein
VIGNNDWITTFTMQDDSSVLAWWTKIAAFFML